MGSVSIDQQPLSRGLLIFTQGSDSLQYNHREHSTFETFPEQPTIRINRSIVAENINHLPTVRFKPKQEAFKAVSKGGWDNSS